MWVDLLPACAPTVHPYTMTEVVRVEHGSPLALHVNGRPADKQPHARTKDEAVALAADSGDREQSVHSIMNTDSGDHEHLFAPA
jgi:hypothetical protein